MFIDTSLLSASRSQRLVVLEPSRTEPVGGTSKRVVDVLVAFTCLVLLAPLMIIIAGLIKATMGGPIFYRQWRVGQNGRTFLCCKFRSMRTDSSERLAALLASDAQAAAEWAANQKLKNDPRVTSLGKLLRESSLDELPQFYNVLIGDMSCVGPRPIIPEEIERYGRYAKDYFSVRPGITGLWQVSGRNTTTYARRIALDRYYARSWSMGLDAMIFFRTFKAVLSRDETS